MLSNGYLLNTDTYKEITIMCDEVIGEIKVANEVDFQKIQRPIEGYILEKHISSMISFNKQYSGNFILEVTIIKGYSDSVKSITYYKQVIDKLSPDKLIIVTIDDERFIKKLGVSKERMDEISNNILSQFE